MEASLASDAALAASLADDELAHARGMQGVQRYLAQRRKLQQLEADLRAQGLRLQRGPGKGGRQRRRRAEQAQIQAQRTVASALD